MTEPVDLGRLTPMQRLVIQLHYYDGWTYLDISEAIGVPPATLRSHAKRALRRLGLKPLAPREP